MQKAVVYDADENPAHSRGLGRFGDGPIAARRDIRIGVYVLADETKED
jgi:hypothetical protein